MERRTLMQTLTLLPDPRPDRARPSCQAHAIQRFPLRRLAEGGLSQLAVTKDRVREPVRELQAGQLPDVECDLAAAAQVGEVLVERKRGG
jgi:hypothetical protein